MFLGSICSLLNIINNPRVVKRCRGQLRKKEYKEDNVKEGRRCSFVCGYPLQEDRDQVKRTRGKRVKRPAGGAERCAADIRARRDRFQDRRGSPCGLPSLNKPLQGGPTVGPNCVRNKSRSVTRDVTRELRDRRDLRRDQAGGGRDRLLRTRGFLRSKRRSHRAFRILRFVHKAEKFLSKTPG